MVLFSVISFPSVFATLDEARSAAVAASGTCCGIFFLPYYSLASKDTPCGARVCVECDWANSVKRCNSCGATLRSASKRCLCGQVFGRNANATQLHDTVVRDFDNVCCACAQLYDLSSPALLYFVVLSPTLPRSPHPALFPVRQLFLSPSLAFSLSLSFALARVLSSALLNLGPPPPPLSLFPRSFSSPASSFPLLVLTVPLC